MNLFRTKFYLQISLVFCFFLVPISADDLSKTEAFFQKIRNYEVILTAFFNEMPKGGDVHHHFSGSVYAETYFEIAVNKNFYVNLESGDTYQSLPTNKLHDSSLKPIRTSIEELGFLPVKLKLISLWSVKDFKETQQTPDKHFFEAFRKFGPLIKGNEDVLLKEIKRRAILEKMQYLETMLLRPGYDSKDPRFVAMIEKYTPMMLKLQAERGSLDSIFDEMFEKLNGEMGYNELAKKHAQLIKTIHEDARLSDEEEDKLVVRYQNYVIRVDNPMDVFAQIFLSFASDNLSDLIVGSNIVGPEDSPNAMRDYWLHMQMFRYFNKKFPHLKYSMHAGELTVGIVPPEELSWHMHSAIYEARAHRIGHGVDISYEKDCFGLMEYMRKKGIAVEVNIISNEFILGVKEDFHPFILYHRAKVPIIISSDDMGVLRTHVTEQFAVLARRYPEVSYKDIKGYVYNSIKYSFLDSKEKKRLKNKLDQEFIEFEKKFARME